MKKLLSLLLLLPVLAFAQGIPIKDGSTSQLAKVNVNGALTVNESPSARVTYIASSGALVTTAAYSLAVESEASRGFKVSQICVSISNATAAAAVNVKVNRTTAASSGGTAATQEGTGADAVSKMDPADSSWSGVVRRTGTLTVGPTLDQWGFQVGVITGAGQFTVVCKQYGLNGEKLPIVAGGTANGLAVQVSSPGAGGLAMGAISITFITET